MCKGVLSVYESVMFNIMDKENKADATTTENKVVSDANFVFLVAQTSELFLQHAKMPLTSQLIF